MLRVLIADDHAITREGLKRILTDYPKRCTSATRQCGADASMVRKNEWDLVLLDISLPDRAGSSAQEHQEDRPALPVLVLSSTRDQYALRVLKAGAQGISPRKVRPSSCWRRFASIRSEIHHPELAEHMPGNCRRNAHAAHEGLF